MKDLSKLPCSFQLRQNQLYRLNLRFVPEQEHYVGLVIIIYNRGDITKKLETCPECASTLPVFVLLHFPIFHQYF